jgi:hypothetical protein
MASQSSFCVFRDITIPSGSVITKAHIYFYSFDTRSGVGIDAEIHFADEDNSQPPTNKTDLDGRSITSSVSWPSIEDWYDNKVYKTPDLKDILQEVLDRGGWVENGNVMAILKVTDGPDSGRFWSALEYLNEVEKACLRVWWRPAEQIQTPFISPSVEFQILNFECSISTYPTDAAIYYTIDGSDPDEGSTLYTAPFTIARSMEVRARAYKEYWLDSEIASRNYSVFGLDCGVDKPETEMALDTEQLYSVPSNYISSSWLGIAPNGVEHVLFAEIGHLYHMYGSYGSWTEPTDVYYNAGDQNPVMTNLYGTFDTSNNLHITFSTYDAYPTFHNYHQVYGKWTGSWSLDATGLPSAHYSNIEVDSTGAPCVATRAYGVFNIGYYRWTGSAWAHQLAVPYGATGYINDWWIQRTSDGLLNMLVAPGTGQNQLFHYNNSGGNWGQVGHDDVLQFTFKEWVGCTGTDFFVLNYSFAVLDNLTQLRTFYEYLHDNKAGDWSRWDDVVTCVAGYYASFQDVSLKAHTDGKMRLISVLYRRTDWDPPVDDLPRYFEFVIGDRDSYTRSYYNFSDVSTYSVSAISQAVHPSTGKIHFIATGYDFTIPNREVVYYKEQ